MVEAGYNDVALRSAADPCPPGPDLFEVAVMTATQSHTDQPLTAWRIDPQHNTLQLTHAVMPGRSIAYCGVRITVVGQPWPELGTSTPLSRCSTCTHAVHQLGSP